MDMVTLAMAKAYADSQRLGYVDIGDELITEGEYGLDIAPDTGVFATVIGEQIEEAPLCDGDTLIVAYDGKRAVLERRNDYYGGWYYTNKGAGDMDITSGVFPADFEIAVLCSLAKNEQTGEVFGYMNLMALKADGEAGETITKKISFYKVGEVIHPIDPKFTPGVLPVFDFADRELYPEQEIKDTEVVEFLDGLKASGALAFIGRIALSDGLVLGGVFQSIGDSVEILGYLISNSTGSFGFMHDELYPDRPPVWVYMYTLAGAATDEQE